MIFDFNDSSISQDHYSAYDVAIVGAGAAGITLALELSQYGKKVALIEGGGLEFSISSQQIYTAKTVGDQYFELNAARLRFFGGTTNHWAGMCRIFGREDFNRGYLGNEFTWPIDFEEIDRYRAKACEILEIENNFDDLTSAHADVDYIDFKFSPPVRFSEKYFATLQQNPLVDIFLNSNLVDINFSGRRIVSINLASYSNRFLSISAQKFVFAMGGIENSRYLLYFRNKYGNNFISDQCPIGEYWMEHPHAALGQVIVDNRKVRGRFFGISPQAQIDDGIMGIGLRLEYHDDRYTNNIIKNIFSLAPPLGESFAELAERNLVSAARLSAAWEQSPQSFNRISLDVETDQFGIPKPILNWRKSELDRQTLVLSLARFNNWLLRTNAGRMQLENWLLYNEDYPPDGMIAGFHHMGGTRMHSSREFGVVDRNCKVHGSSNLYIAGSSIFTTGGHNNPTLPIVQFAIRLAEYLAA